MRVLLIETTQYYPSSPLFLDGLKELAAERRHQYAFFDEALFLRPLSHSLMHKVAYRVLGRRPLTYWSLNRSLVRYAQCIRPNVVVVAKGAYLAPETLVRIKHATGAILVNYATDDPFNAAVNTADQVAAIPLYDVYACPRRAIMDDVTRVGCATVVYAPFGYQPAVHFQEEPRTQAEKDRFCSDVVFAGGCDKDRVPYFELLLRAIPGLKLHLYGGYWERYPVLRPYHRGFAIGRDFRLALHGSKIALNLVRRANRDGHTMRTFEVTACGAFMLAERTPEHLDLYKDGLEAGYFDSPDELVDKVRYYLAHEQERKNIAEAGRRRVVAGGHTYKDRLIQMLQAAGMSV